MLPAHLAREDGKKISATPASRHTTSHSNRSILPPLTDDRVPSLSTTPPVTQIHYTPVVGKKKGCCIYQSSLPSFDLDYVPNLASCVYRLTSLSFSSSRSRFDVK